MGERASGAAAGPGDLMRVLIVTAGSRGDVAPFTGLGRRLQQAGHQVTLAAHGRFADLVRDCGLEYRALPGTRSTSYAHALPPPRRWPRDRSSPRSWTSWATV